MTFGRKKRRRRNSIQIKLINFRRFFTAARIGFGDFVARVAEIREADKRETYDENGIPASEVDSR
jgi:hypothetical protein